MTCHEKKRWGKKFVDKRDWVKYNEELVFRGEFYLDYDWVKSWEKEVEELNKNKVGAKYVYPPSLIRLQAVWHLMIAYREIEGITRKLFELGKVLKCNDHTTINRRVNSMDPQFTLPQSGSFSASCDGTGMKFGNAGEYKARMYGKERKKCIKVVLTSDPKKRKLLDCSVSVEGEGKSEPETAEEHIGSLLFQGITITDFWGDGAFDTLDLFALMEKNNIKSHIKIRKGSIDKGEDSLRDKEVALYKKKGYKKWAKENGYGMRWVGTEGVFSAVKRRFGEETRSAKIENAFNEIKRKFWAYDEIKEYAKAMA